LERRLFAVATTLTCVALPSGVKSIGKGAFDGCSGLKDVTVEWITPLFVNEYTFDDMPLTEATLHVPRGTKAFYKADEVWKQFRCIIAETAKQNGESVGRWWCST
jgi:hypothetical protein